MEHHSLNSWSNVASCQVSKSTRVWYHYSAPTTNAPLRVSTVSRPVASNTKKMDANSPSGDACWRSRRIVLASWPFWRTLTSWLVTLPSVRVLGSCQLSSPRSCLTVIMTLPVANKSRKRFWPLCTRWGESEYWSDLFRAGILASCLVYSIDRSNSGAQSR